MARDHTATMEALHDPQVGDRFHEMYSFWMYVLAVTPAHITITSASSPCTFPDDGKVETLTRDAFVERFSYGTIPGAWVSLRNRGSNVEGWLPEPTLAIVDDVFFAKFIADTCLVRSLSGTYLSCRWCHRQDTLGHAGDCIVRTATAFLEARTDVGKDAG